MPLKSRLDNAPGRRDVRWMSAPIFDRWCASYERPSAVVNLDGDDTADVGQGCQQLSLSKSRCEERYFLPTAACLLMLTLRNAVPRSDSLARAEFAARVNATCSRARIAVAAACLEAALFAALPRACRPQPS